LFEYKTRGNEQVVTRVADQDNWKQIKETLIQNVGTGTIPVIKVIDSDYKKNRTLLLKHDHDGRDLQLEYAEKTLQFIQQLWDHDVALETIIEQRPILLSFADNKLTIKQSV
jgi:stage V sporulation protein R